MSVITIKDQLGHRLAAEGTWPHRRALTELARAVRPFAPGAAAALVDWAGPEVARLRAYAIASAALREHADVDRDAFHLVA